MARIDFGIVNYEHRFKNPATVYFGCVYYFPSFRMHDNSRLHDLDFGGSTIFRSKLDTSDNIIIDTVRNRPTLNVIAVIVSKKMRALIKFSE